MKGVDEQYFLEYIPTKGLWEEIIACIFEKKNIAVAKKLVVIEGKDIKLKGDENGNSTSQTL